MKNIINLFVLSVCLTFVHVKRVNAQEIEGSLKYNSTVTDALGLSNVSAIAGTRGSGTVLSDVFKEKLDDVFVVVVPAGSTAQEDNDTELLGFQVGDKTVFDIRIQDGKINVRRLIGDNWASYIIYDEVFYFRNIFTFIISANYIAIMVDEEGAKWNIAPVLFGLNSNDGTDQYSAGMGSHETPYFNSNSSQEGMVRSVYDFTIYPMTDEYDTYAEIQTWLNDPTQKDLSVNAKRESETAENVILAPMSEVSEFIEEADVDFYIYPNPSSESIALLGLEANEIVLIYDMIGNKIMETKEKQINVSTFSQGIYIIKSISGKNVLKFVKQ